MLSSQTASSEASGGTTPKRQWIDPQKKKDKEQRRFAEKKRRERTRTDTVSRRIRVMEYMVDLQSARDGSDLTVAEGRALVVKELMARLNPAKKSKSKEAEDDSGHLRSLQEKSPEKLFMERSQSWASECLLLMQHCSWSNSSANITT